ncbi:hypothetical protein [Fuscibacter oryzae]|uniref:Uncharacterized protein n=1 Tax=Fuscibacter oryzae TaxID=2803939 RepID=A0A8J7MQH9_9RHOB|nr:hypothetical protein [Fuscibacter oryzae]MBL4929355.1 hypothetical protein [Fuscibacter oryzae]
MRHRAATVWTDARMLEALDMRDRRKMTAAQIAKALGSTRSAVCGMFKRIADDEAETEGNA